MKFAARLFGLALLVLATGSGAVDLPDVEPGPDERVVVYSASFFETYQPISALDMIARVPGFQIREGGGARGFGGTPGNVLINGERPSSKRDSAADLLDRIPAGQVERIELIRGQGGGLDLRGQSVAVNVILRETGGRAVQWSASVEQDTDSGGPTPTGEASLTRRAGSTRFTVGARASRFFFGNPAFERLSDASGPVEQRFEQERTKGHNAGINFNSDTVLERWRLQGNFDFEYQQSRFRERSRREPLAAGEPVRVRIRGDEDEDLDFELGGDAEYAFNDDLATKAIGLFRFSGNDSAASDEAFLFEREFRDASLARSRRDETESILRAELDWSGWDGHVIEADIEGAFNTLDNALDLSVDEGQGPVDIEVPGANTRVEELRGDASVADSWRLARWLVETGLAAEVSRISQTGSVGEDQTFFFVKPRLTVTWAPARSRQSRLRFEREVAQLDFFDFVSATNFEDNDLDLGNPDLSPESTWVVELTQEQRFGEIGVVSVTAFGNWIADVEDLLPVGDRFEVPGNIGDGRRLGVTLEATLPLERLAIRGGRLDVETRWQDSRVTDPVTGQTRELSGEREFEFELEFRQDLSWPRLSWGWEVETETAQTSFGVDELDRFDEGVDLEAFVETSQWLGVKFSLTAQNILNREFTRDRRVFDGRRGTGGLLFGEDRDRRRGRSLILGVSGSF